MRLLLNELLVKKISMEKWPSKCTFDKAKEIMDRLLGSKELPWDPLTWIVWLRWVKEGQKCSYCDLDGKNWDNWRQMETEHIIPSKSYHPLNLTVACSRCNSVKRNWNPVTSNYGYNPTDLSEPKNEDERQKLIIKVREYLSLQYTNNTNYYTESIFKQQVSEGSFSCNIVYNSVTK